MVPRDPNKPLTRFERRVLAAVVGGAELEREMYRYQYGTKRNRDPERHFYRLRIDGQMGRKCGRGIVDHLVEKGYLTGPSRTPTLTPAGREVWENTDKIGRWKETK